MCVTCERNSMNGRSADPWVRRFSVDETRRHPGGFTIYKITSVLFQLAAPDAATVVCVWKRYSDIRALHASMATLHSALHLAGAPPPLPRAAYFRRFDANVITERAAVTKSLLEFVAEHRLLFTSGEFVTFLKSGYDSPNDEEATTTTEGGMLDALRSAWQPHPADVPALDCPEHEAPVLTPVKVSPTSPLHTPLIPTNDTNSQTHLLEPSLLRTLETPNSPSGSLSSWGSASSLFDELDAASPRHMSRDQLHMAPERLHVARNLPDLISFRTEEREADGGTVGDAVHTPSNSATSDHYMTASCLLKQAAQRQQVGDLLGAFHYYRSGIEHMLHGVQDDTDPQRRRVIKEKTSQYLAYAEAIYRDHLAAEDHQVEEDTETNDSATECLEDLDPTYPTPVACTEHRVLKRPNSELGQYRVLSIGPQGQICLVHVPSQACRALQVIQKIPHCNGENETIRPLLPTNIPYMARLHAYVESRDLLFLMTDRAPGGRLIDYIQSCGPKSVESTTVLDAQEREATMDNTDVRWDDDLSVNDLVINSQRLLLEVDNALSDERAPEVTPDVRAGQERATGAQRTEDAEREGARERRSLPPATVRQWGAELLTAIEHLHMAGVVCRELSIDKLLLGQEGQLLLEYTPCYATNDVTTANVCMASLYGSLAWHVAPELQEGCAAVQDAQGSVDWWSYGAVMYELICREPLSSRHRGAFTSHTLLQFPPGVPLEAESLLTELLTYDPAQRLGAGGAREVKGHLYFRGVDWHHVRRSWRPPPD